MNENSKDSDYDKVEEHLCLEVIPGTFIMCGEGEWYCSQECLEKAKGKK
jgi:hypothetical protein